MSASWEASTRAQYDDETNLAARQAIFEYLIEATPLAAPLSDMSVLDGKRVLDVGCGNGMFLTAAGNGGANAIGLDASLGMAKVAAEGSEVPVVQALAEAIPVADHSIDTVLALWMLYHVADKPAALAEFRRVLTAEGTLVATTNSAARSDLDELVCDALTQLLGRQVEHWHPPLDFTAENGAEILDPVFGQVETHEFGNVFEVTDPDILVRYVGSMLEPIKAQNGELVAEDLLRAVGEACESQLAARGAVRIERAGAVFIARVAQL